MGPENAHKSALFFLKKTLTLDFVDTSVRTFSFKTNAYNIIEGFRYRSWRCWF